MTSSTAKAGFVSANLDTGYRIELAGGGRYKAAALRSKVAKLQKLTSTGVGAALNSLCTNPCQLTLQPPFRQGMGKGSLLTGELYVAAGVSTTEKVADAIDGLKAAGINRVIF